MVDKCRFNVVNDLCCLLRIYIIYSIILLWFLVWVYFNFGKFMKGKDGVLFVDCYFCLNV